MSDVSDDMMSSVIKPKRTHRLSDKILIAFHFACDQRDIEVAALLLNVLEAAAAPSRLVGPLSDYKRHQVQESLVGAYERLWDLRQPTSLPRTSLDQQID